jgi:hypothetical protein
MKSAFGARSQMSDDEGEEGSVVSRQQDYGRMRKSSVIFSHKEHIRCEEALIHNSPVIT